jgi:hypothetical protein
MSVAFVPNGIQGQEIYTKDHGDEYNQLKDNDQIHLPIGSEAQFGSDFCAIDSLSRNEFSRRGCFISSVEGLTPNGMIRIQMMDKPWNQPNWSR